MSDRCTHTYTHACTHARTHAHTHKHTQNRKKRKGKPHNKSSFCHNSSPKSHTEFILKRVKYSSSNLKWFGYKENVCWKWKVMGVFILKGETKVTCTSVLSTSSVLRYSVVQMMHFLLFSFTVTGLHDIDEYIQAQLLLAVRIFYLCLLMAVFWLTRL